MTRSMLAISVFLLMILLGWTRAPLNGQTHILLELGSTFPVGSLTDSGSFSGANTGWQGAIGVQWPLGSSGIDLGARAYYGANGHEGPDQGESSLKGIAALATWTLTDGPVRPLVWSQAGLLLHEYSADSGGLLGGGVDSKEEALSFAGGVGLGVPAGWAELQLLTGYTHAFGVFADIRYFSLSVATSLSVG